ncbi:MAG: hypothetical protein H7Z42_22265 [Roseiflexaceae bacterium]|nr:hypothetical protein [Roseiflexaceae bacterium]
MKHLRPPLLGFALVALLPWFAAPPTALAATTYEVGPGKTYAKLSDVADSLKPGDTVLVASNGTSAYLDAVVFREPGSASAPITIRGVRNTSGQRPILSSGGATTVEFNADHYVFEGFEATGNGGNGKVLYHHADAITIRDTLVRDCPNHGILGADEDSGSLTLDRVEVRNCGNGEQKHSIYIATDKPSAIFRMQFSYVHSAKGGNAVKSRAQRNEIYYNWLEDSRYHELELLGPDDGTGGAKDAPRRDADVVGNVFVKRQGRNSNGDSLLRIGGDGTGQTWGRYRFVNNTFVTGTRIPVIWAFTGIESVEFHNNVFVNVGGGGLPILNAQEADWRDGRVVTGSKNWVQRGSDIPAEFTGTVLGDTPGFVNLSAFDLRPSSAASPLVDVGANTPASPAGHEFPNPLALPLQHPPQARIDVATLRPVNGPIDIGAYEFGVAAKLDPRAYLPLARR